MKKLFLLAAILAVGNMAQGETVKLEDTVVTSEQGFEQSIFEVTKNVTVITAEDIEKKGAKSVAEALEGVPNLIVRSMSGTDVTFDLRGQGTTAKSNVMVLLDGIPLNSIDMSGYKTSQIPIDSVEKIEVIPNGGSVLYGDGAVGGAINIITKNPKKEKGYGYIGAEAGSYGLFKTDTSYGTYVGENTLVNLNYSNKNFDTHRDEARDDLEAFDIKVRQLLNEGYLDFKYGYSKTDFIATGAIIGKENAENNPNQIGDSILKGTNEDNVFGVSYNQKISDNLEILVEGNRKDTKYRSEWVTYKSKRNTDTITDYLKSQIKYTYLDNNYLILGGDYLDGDTEVVTHNQEYKKEAQGLFAINKFYWNKFEFQQGYRYQEIEYTTQEKDKRKFDENALDLSVNYLLNDTSSIYFSYNTGFRTPNTDELNLWYGDYEPQKSKTYEIGTKTTLGNTFISGAIFYTETENEIYYGRAEDSQSYNKNMKGTNERKGVELSATHYFDKLTLSGMLSYIEHEMGDNEYKGKKIPGVPNIIGNVTASYNINDKLVLNTIANYNGESYYNDDFENSKNKLDSYIIVNANIKYKYDENLDLYIGVNNIFDELYYDYAAYKDYLDNYVYYPASGRSYYAGFKYSF